MRIGHSDDLGWPGQMNSWISALASLIVTSFIILPIISSTCFLCFTGTLDLSKPALPPQVLYQPHLPPQIHLWIKVLASHSSMPSPSETRLISFSIFCLCSGDNTKSITARLQHKRKRKLGRQVVDDLINY
jgi:hypothetical protein